jgi:hypothetical protein
VMRRSRSRHSSRVSSLSLRNRGLTARTSSSNPSGRRRGHECFLSGHREGPPTQGTRTAAPSNRPARRSARA